MKPAVPTDNATLRHRAESRLKRQKVADRGPKTDLDTVRLLHELQVHQIELELQNEELQRAKDEVEAGLVRYTDLYDFAPVGYFTLGPDGDILQINCTGALFFGVERARLVHRRLASLVAEPDRALLTAFIKRAFDQRTKEFYEMTLLPSKGRVLSVRLEANVSPEKPECRVVMADITERKLAEEAIHRLNTELEERVRQRTVTIRKLATELTLAEQRERTRLSHILHEDLQQLIIGASFILQPLQTDLPVKDRKRIKRVNDILSQANQIARTLAVELSPPILQDEGLAAVLRWLSQWMKEHHGLTVKLTGGETLPPLPEELSVILYQSVRELLFNVIKHAKVKSASVSMDCANGRVNIVVGDKGAGFASASQCELVPSAGQFGLFSVRERLILLDGRMDMESVPKQGTRITLSVPLRQPGTDLRTHGQRQP